MLFDVILRTQSIIADWVLVLFKLLLSGIIKPHQPTEYTMFTDVTDMVVILLHMVQLNETLQPAHQSGGEVLKYATITKRLRVSVLQSIIFNFM